MHINHADTGYYKWSALPTMQATGLEKSPGTGLSRCIMAKTYIIVEKSQIRSLSVGGGWWFVLQGKFDEMAPLTLVDHEAEVTLSDNSQQKTVITDAAVRNGVLSIKFDHIDGLKVGRQAALTVY